MRIYLLIVLLALGAAMPGCSTNPATGKKQLNMLSESSEIELGKNAAPEFIKEGGGPIPDQHIAKYVSDLGLRLAKLSERPDLPWEVTVLDSEIVNAFAIPGGKVFISRGLLAKMTNEAQLAGVLGHEVGHVTAQHGGQQLTQQVLIGVGAAVVSTQVDDDERWIPLMVGTGGQLYLLRYSRSHESQADELGLRYMTRAGYDPKAMVEVMHILEEAGGKGGIEWLQTHPLPKSRIEDIERQIAEQYAHTQNNPNFQLKAAEFKRNVLDRLADLPPAKHPPKKEPKKK